MKISLKYISSAIVSLVVLFYTLRFVGISILPDITGTISETSQTVRDVEKGVLLGRQAPLFDLPDARGGRVKSSQYIGVSGVVVMFWATWNKESADQVKIFDDYLTHHAGDRTPVQLIAVNSQEDASVASSFIRRGSYAVPFALDTYGDVSQSFKIKSLPTTYFVGRDGNVQEIYVGLLSEGMIVDKIEQILK